jgi:6-pyruvoyltetrahydropterin/6-carboxytetrahydropterin synthase
MYTLTMEHKFSAAHKLTNAYSKECNDNIHGHNWKVVVKIQVKELVNNMVIDFKILKEKIDFLDHRNLNDILDFEPTAEALAGYLWTEIGAILPQDDSHVSIELFEADKASITYERDFNKAEMSIKDNNIR